MTTIVMLPTPPAAQPARSAQPSRSGGPGAATDRDFARTLDEVSGRQDPAEQDDATADVPADVEAPGTASVDGSEVRADGTGARPDGGPAHPDGEPVRPAALLLSIAQIVQTAAGALDAAAGSRPVDAAAVLAAGVAVPDAQVTATATAAGTAAAASTDGEPALAPVIDLASRRAGAHVPTQRGAGGQLGAAGAAGDATGVRPAADPATLGAPAAPVLGADAAAGAPRLFAVEAPSVPGTSAEAPATDAADGAPVVRPVEAPVASGSATQAPSAAVGVSPTAAPTATTAATPTTAPASPQTPAEVPLAEQLSGRLTSLRSAGPGQHVLTLRVDPESIGPVRVVAHIGADGVRIELFGGNDQAREALRQAMPDLRRDLLAAGLAGGLDLGTGSGPGLRGQGTGTGTGAEGGAGQGRAPGGNGSERPGAEAGAAPTTPTVGGHAAHLDLLV